MWGDAGYSDRHRWADESDSSFDEQSDPEDIEVTFPAAENTVEDDFQMVTEASNKRQPPPPEVTARVWESLGLYVQRDLKLQLEKSATTLDQPKRTYKCAWCHETQHKSRSCCRADMSLLIHGAHLPFAMP